MHTTGSADVVHVISGQIDVEMENGDRTTLHGDVLIQNGTRHTWHNASDQPVVVALAVIGATSRQ